jgi:hypothetical protein
VTKPLKAVRADTVARIQPTEDGELMRGCLLTTGNFGVVLARSQGGWLWGIFLKVETVSTFKGFRRRASHLEEKAFAGSRNTQYAPARHVSENTRTKACHKSVSRDAYIWYNHFL